MNKEQKLIDMVEYLRHKVAEEALHQADSFSTQLDLKRQIEQQDEKIKYLQERLEKISVPTETTIIDVSTTN